MSDGDDIRAAAKKALDELRATPAPGAKVTRAVLEVDVAGRTEMVTVVMRDGKVRWSSPGGAEDEAHVVAALAALAGTAQTPVPGDAGAETTLPGIRTVDDIIPDSANRTALADVLDEVVGAVVRIGVREASGSPTVKEGVERLIASAPSPLPLGISRWVGMFREAVAARDLGTVARILDGAARVAQDLRDASPSREARRRIVSWLGTTADVPGDIERISDRVLVEVGREQLNGVERIGIERRYLVDLDSGEILREERARGLPGGSFGPCPRIVTVGLGEVEDGAPPRRVRFLQYAVSNSVADDQWARVEEMAFRRFGDLATDYRRALARYPGLAEPFAIVAPKSCQTDDIPVLLDADGQPLPIAHADDPALDAALRKVADGRVPAWVAGRLTDADGVLLMNLCAAGFHDGRTAQFLRLT